MRWLIANLFFFALVGAGAAALFFGFALIKLIGFSHDTEQHVVGALAIAAVFIPGLVARAALARLGGRKT